MQVVYELEAKDISINTSKFRLKQVLSILLGMSRAREEGEKSEPAPWVERDNGV